MEDFINYGASDTEPRAFIRQLLDSLYSVWKAKKWNLF
jgi:hypothetical protein